MPLYHRTKAGAVHGLAGGKGGGVALDVADTQHKKAGRSATR